MDLRSGTSQLPPMPLQEIQSPLLAPLPYSFLIYNDKILEESATTKLHSEPGVMVCVLGRFRQEDGESDANLMYISRDPTKQMKIK